MWTFVVRLFTPTRCWSCWRPLNGHDAQECARLTLFYGSLYGGY